MSRGGEKLESALDRFGIATAGRRCLDVGASTGGFTDCLLQRGACSVTALDVGHGQLHARLRVDPRVTVVERMNVRHVSPEVFGGCFDLVVGDLSFISLTKVAKQIVELASPGAPLVLLVKPQFEAGRQEANRARGVIKDPAIWLRTLKEVAEAFAGAGGVPRRAIVSPLRGGQGNVEFLLQLVRTGQPGADVADHLALDALAEAAVLDVTERGL